MKFTPEGVLVAVTRADGGVSVQRVLMVARGSQLPHGAAWIDERAGMWGRDPTPDVIEREVRQAHGADAIKWRIIDDADLPARDDYRDSIVDDGKSLRHDMPKAREKHRTLLRHERARTLPELDAKWMRAVGQRWRDAPADPRIDAAGSVDDLRALLP